MITVKVTITERVKYSSYVDMTAEKYNDLDDKLQTLRGSELRKLEEHIGGFCDRIDDWQDADDLEIEEFEIVDTEADK